MTLPPGCTDHSGYLTPVGANLFFSFHWKWRQSPRFRWCWTPGTKTTQSCVQSWNPTAHTLLQIPIDGGLIHAWHCVRQRGAMSAQMPAFMGLLFLWQDFLLDVSRQNCRNTKLGSQRGRQSAVKRLEQPWERDLEISANMMCNGPSYPTTTSSIIAAFLMS